MTTYTIRFHNETSEMLDLTVFQKPPESPSLPGLAWFSTTMPPSSSEFTLPIPMEFISQEYFVSVANPEHPDIKTDMMRVHPGQTCKISGDKTHGYKIELA